MNKKYLLTGITSVLAIGGVWLGGSSFGGVAHAADTNGAYVSSLSTAIHSNGVLEYVNHHSVSRKEFLTYAAGKIFVANLNHTAIPSETQLLHQFNVDEVLYYTAESENIGATLAQAQKYAQYVRTTLDNPPANMATNKAVIATLKANLKSEESGFGVSANDYWTKIAPYWYQRGMTINAIKNQFVSSYLKSHPNVNNTNLEQALNNYETQLFNSATISQTP